MFGKIGKPGYAVTPPAPVPQYEPACMVQTEVEYTVNNMSEKTLSLHRCVLPFYSDCAMLLHKALLMLLLRMYCQQKISLEQGNYLKIQFRTTFPAQGSDFMFGF